MALCILLAKLETRVHEESALGRLSLLKPLKSKKICYVYEYLQIELQNDVKHIGAYSSKE